MKRTLILSIIAGWMLLIYSTTPTAQIYTPMPVPKMQFLDGSGNPVSNGKLYSYVSGTSTPLDTYSNSSGALNTNPVILDSEGRATVFMSSAVSYRFRLDTSASVTVWGPIDGVRFAALDSVTGTANQITVSANTGSVTFSLAGPHAYTTQTQYGVVYGNATGALGSTAAGSSSMVLISTGGTAPSFSGSPTLASVILTPTAFASLGTATSGTLKFCSNCTASGWAVCAATGTGTLAVGNGTSWMC